MRLIKRYIPPSVNDLRDLRYNLKMQYQDMAALAGVAENQWGKYVITKSPRRLSVHMLFFMASQLTMTDKQLREVIEKMRDIGATVDLSE